MDYSMDFTSGTELLALCDAHDLRICDVMRLREMEAFERSREEIDERMAHSYEVMKQSIDTALLSAQESMGGFLGGEAIKLLAHHNSGQALSGPIGTKAAAYAMGVLETNASMGRIVATPTAGSAGILPGVLRAMQEEFAFDDEACIDALFTASALGYITARNASVSGARGGCQAEIGVASAMAASAAVQLRGGTPWSCLDAADLAIINILGLVCDPIGGLVEEPCQKRNAMGTANALISADIALSGISSVIPFDEAIEVLDKVGHSIPYELRETALGGIATAPSACARCQSLFCDEIVGTENLS